MNSLAFPLSPWQMVGTYVLGIVVTNFSIIYYYSRYGSRGEYFSWVTDCFLRYLQSIFWPVIIIEFFVGKIFSLVKFIHRHTLARLEALAHGEKADNES